MSSDEESTQPGADADRPSPLSQGAASERAVHAASVTRVEVAPPQLGSVTRVDAAAPSQTSVTGVTGVDAADAASAHLGSVTRVDVAAPVDARASFHEPAPAEEAAYHQPTASLDHEEADDEDAVNDDEAPTGEHTKVASPHPLRTEDEISVGTGATRTGALDPSAIKAAFAAAEASERSAIFASPFGADLGPSSSTDASRHWSATAAGAENAQEVHDPSVAHASMGSAPPPEAPGALGSASQPAPKALPAHEVDADDDERRLLKSGAFLALLDLYRARLARAQTPAAQAETLHKIASVHEHCMLDREEAFLALVAAFETRPTDDVIVASLERVAREEGRIGELATRAMHRLPAAEHELKVVLLGHLVYWHERLLGRYEEAASFASELERLDKTHPVVLRRAAAVAGAQGDLKLQRELLLRALETVARPSERTQIHLALAGAHAGMPEAAKHYEAAITHDAACVVALQGLEHILRAEGKHPQVAWCLERQIEAAPTTAERVDALLRLAELYEVKYLKREPAAAVYERVIELEPTHPEALKGLERCYHALRDWPRLAAVLRKRAENAYDKPTKIELLELAAEVLDAKLGDAASAIEIHRDLLVIDPKHRRALTDLARLYEKLGDWANMATYKARVAELASTRRQASQQLVALGDYLSVPGRDPISARLQYERAVVVDQSNPNAWEALQRIANEAGDDRRVIETLTRRAETVDGPRQRAATYVELAALHRAHNDAAAARAAFEHAIAADPTNETAAVAMLDFYSADENWQAAAPLCDLLVNAATRDDDKPTLYARRRLATRIGAALGDAERAMTSALAALDLQPDDDGAQADLIAICIQCRSTPRVLKRANEWLARIAEGRSRLPVAAFVGLAQLQREASDLQAARRTLRRAREWFVGDPLLQKERFETYLADGDFSRACAVKIEMAKDATDDDARFQALCDAGEIWARRAEDLDRAAPIFEEARRIKPLDHWLLHTLMWLYGETGRWEDLSSVLESIALIQEIPERKAKSLFAMAQVFHEKLHDPARAAALFDQVLDIDASRLDAFEQIVRILTERKDWDELERAYRKMIGRIDDGDTSNLRFLLLHQLGLIYRDRRHEPARALAALEEAAALRPDDTIVRKSITELLVLADELDRAVVRTRARIAGDPHDAELYVELYDLFLRQRRFDEAWCSLNVLAQMRDLTDEQARFLGDYPPTPIECVPGQIVEGTWQSHLLHPDLDPALTALFARMTPAVARMRHAQLRPEQLLGVAGRPFTSAHSELHDSIRMTFENAAEILQLKAPELLLGEPSALVPFAPALAPFGAIHVGATAVEARADTLVYVIGKRLAEQRPELIARAFFTAASELALLLASAIRLATDQGARDPASAALDAGLSGVLTAEERDSIRAIVLRANMTTNGSDVGRWSQAADLSSMRAGLLLCGDVGQAKRTIVADPQSPADLAPRDRIGELYIFGTSEAYFELRAAIGVGVPPATS